MTFFALITFILSAALSTKKYISTLYSRLTLVVFFITILMIGTVFDYSFFYKSLTLFNGLISFSLANLTFICFIYILTCFILLMTSYYPYSILSSSLESRENKTKDFSYLNNISNTQENTMYANIVKESLSENDKEVEKLEITDVFQSSRAHYNIIEYSLIIQFIIIGSITLLSSNDLITIFLSIELQSYGLYILSTLYRDSESSTGAGLTYFLLGGLSSCIILLGQSFIYINTGTTNLDSLYIIHNIITSNQNLQEYIQNENVLTTIFTLNYYQQAIQFSLIIMTVGFLFKISASPFHSWSPGVYDAIPTVTTTFVAIIPKISILILLFDVIYSTWYTSFDYSWTNIIIFSSFLSLIIGSVLGLTQTRIKRLYAYSTVSHVGFMLLALSVHNVESIQAFFFYLIQYSLSNLNAFLIIVVIGYTYVYYVKKTESVESISDICDNYKKKINELSPLEELDQLKGYSYLNPMLAMSLSITLYSFIGVPPLVGFFAKQMILSSALDNGDIFMCLIAILTSVVSAVYYLYIIKEMYFEKSKYMPNINLNQLINDNILKDNPKKMKNTYTVISITNVLTCLIAVLSLAILLFIFLYSEIYLLISILSIFITY